MRARTACEATRTGAARAGDGGLPSRRYDARRTQLQPTAAGPLPAHFGRDARAAEIDVRLASTARTSGAARPLLLVDPLDVVPAQPVEQATSSSRDEPARLEQLRDGTRRRASRRRRARSNRPSIPRSAADSLPSTSSLTTSTAACRPPRRARTTSTSTASASGARERLLVSPRGRRSAPCRPHLPSAFGTHAPRGRRRRSRPGSRAGPRAPSAFGSNAITRPLGPGRTRGVDRDEAEVRAALEHRPSGGDRLGEQADEGPLAAVLEQLADVVELREARAAEPNAVHVELEALERARRRAARARRRATPSRSRRARPATALEHRQCRELRSHGSHDPTGYPLDRPMSDSIWSRDRPRPTSGATSATSTAAGRCSSPARTASWARI